MSLKRFLKATALPLGKAFRETGSHGKFAASLLPGRRAHTRQKKPMSVACVQIGKAYVSYHLIPAYACSDLLKGISKKLRARMQGKSCFNFQSADRELFAEHEELTL